MSNHEPLLMPPEPLPILQSVAPWNNGFGRPLTCHERKLLRQLTDRKIPITNGTIVVRGMAYSRRGKPKQYYYQAICRVTRAPGAMINPRHRRIPR